MTTRPNKTVFALLAAFSSSLGLSAAPMVAIGDNAALFVTGVAGITYQDNVFRTETNRIDDFFFRLQPGVELQFGSPGAASAALFASGEILRYADQSGLNNELLHLLLTASLDEQVYQISFFASYDERSINSLDRASEITDASGIARDLNDTAVQLNGRYSFSNLTSVSAGLVFNRRDYSEQGLAGSESFSVPVSLFYEISPVLDARLGYQWRKVDIIGSSDTFVDSYRDNHFTVGLVGELGSPVFTGDVSVGWMERKFRGDIAMFPFANRTINSITYDVGVTYNATNSSYTLRLERDYMTSIFGGQNFSRSQISVLGRFSLVPMWSATAMLGYSFSDYSNSDREQDDYFGRVGVHYAPNEYVRVSATISHNRVDGSGLQASGYRANTFSVSASLRY
jgi:hypothetical protein